LIDSIMSVGAAREQVELAKSTGLPIPIGVFQRCLNRSRTCIWRYVQYGWLATININGKLFVASNEATRFAQRAAAGEFSKKPVMPARKGASAQ